MQFYTWKDIERHFFMHSNEWKEIMNVEVYPDELVIGREKENEEKCKEILRCLFPRNLMNNCFGIKLDAGNTCIQISYEDEYLHTSNNKMPLFKKAIYQDSVYPDKDLVPLHCPVIAFHSYKGGVGRTLSLIAFAKAWTHIQKEPQNNKLLIIDSDLEAPGLTLIQGGVNDLSFSYLDLLTLIQDNNSIEKIVDTTVDLIGEMTFPIETEEQIVEHFFLPTYRYIEQLYDLYASPQTITNSKNKEYIIAEVLSKVADQIGAKAVLVDLRAGISEYSAPLLLDPRVRKYCVTSTSRQSIMGTRQILKFMSKGLSIKAETLLPKIFLNMIPDSFSNLEKEKIKISLKESFTTTEEEAEYLDNMVVELPFASELIHLTGAQQILSVLKDREMYYRIEEIVKQFYSPMDAERTNYSEKEHIDFLDRIHQFASNQITAEANGAAALLLTAPIKNLCVRFKNHIPTTIVQGAKGAGKTFLYRQLIEKKNWTSFCAEINQREYSVPNGFFIPVLAPKSILELESILEKCIENLNSEVDFADVSSSVYVDNVNQLSSYCTENIDWAAFWEQLFATSVHKDIHSLSELDERLKREEKKIVFLIDGLEEIFKEVAFNAVQQNAITVLCQGILNTMAVKYENIGLIVFLRSDMAQNAITVNYEQFKQVFNYAELKWSSDEALRLVVWLVSHAIQGFYKEPISVENASKAVIEKYLEKLWGLKLGKANSNEAYTSNWILAALSDFNGQLQARDIIRFLKYASYSSDKKPAYCDRILMPLEIRHAVPKCSKDKITEIKVEYDNLKPIFEKLENLKSNKKTLPIIAEEGLLTAMEEKMMIQAGYLTRDGGKLYLPEIIRHALGFRYEKGARPKVLSLLQKH